MTGAHGDVDWELLARCVAGEVSEDEQAAVEAWDAADPKRRRLLEELQQVWDAVGEETRPSQPLDVRAAWQRLDRRIDEKKQRRRGAVPREDGPRRGPPRPRRRSARAGARARRRLRNRSKAAVLGAVAIAVVAVAAVTTVALLLGEGGLVGTNEKVFTTARGQQATVRLADGTEVHLNVDSRLALPASGFATDRRAVRLDGEAFFDVARDAARPFWVRTRDASVRVVGTAFGVRAYAGEEPAQVAVAEGEVALQARATGAADAPMRLTARQVGTVDRAGPKKRRDVDLSAYLSWTEGRLVFEDASISAVARKLERWYDLRVEVRVRPETVDRLNAAFKDESPRQVLDDVALALGLQYEKKRQVVTFYRSTQARTRPDKATQPVLAE